VKCHVLPILGLSLLIHCGSPPAPRPPTGSADPPRGGATSTTSPAPPPPDPVAVHAAPDAAVPPLSTPNALSAPKADAGNEAEPPAADPRMAGIRRIAVAAQDCHARHAAGIQGHLMLRIAPDHAGAVKSVSVVRAQSSGSLARPAFETCVLDAAKKERLSPARDEDDEVELPLTFEPTQ
jgi:hypothetical protein